jgi:hypothetical protein
LKDIVFPTDAERMALDAEFIELLALVKPEDEDVILCGLREIIFRAGEQSIDVIKIPVLLAKAFHPMKPRDLGERILRLDAEDRHRKAIYEAILSGALIVRDHAGFRIPSHASEIQVNNATATIEALKDYAAGFDVIVRVAEVKDASESLPESTPQTAPASAPETPTALLPEQTADAGLPKRERQIRAIEAAAAGQGCDALSIPTGWKKILMKQCQKSNPVLFGAGPDPFNGAWRVAIACDPPRLRMTDHKKFAGK